MLNSSYLAGISDELVKLYSDLEHSIALRMAMKINKVQKITDSVQYNLEIMEQTGMLRKEVLDLIERYNAKAEPILRKAFQDALTKSTENDLKYFQHAKRNLSERQRQVIETSVKRFLNSETINKRYDEVANVRAAFDKTYRNIQRMTMTVADSCNTSFIAECNKAYMKVSTGMTSYQSAYKTAVKNLACDGVKYISYSSSGKLITYSIESATRMNVLTSINETASMQTLDNCQELGADLVETSAHIGARDVERDGRPWSNHAEWQGKVFCLNGEREYTDENGEKQIAPDFQSSCGLGEADGICGINCRHSYYPYFEGTPLLYSNGELDEMKEQTVFYDSHEMSRFEADQKLRYIEREIRQSKREIDAINVMGGDSSTESAQLREWQAKARDFCEKTGIQRDYTREYVGTMDTKQPR